MGSSLKDPQVKSDIKKVEGQISSAKSARTRGDAIARRNRIITDALEDDSADIRASRARAKKARLKQANSQKCPLAVGGNEFGTQSPAQGWSGKRADSDWIPANAGLRKAKLNQIQSVIGNQPVKFRKGYPVFDPHIVEIPHSANGQPAKCAVKIAMSKSGDRNQDFKNARVSMAQNLGLVSPDEASTVAGQRKAAKMMKKLERNHPEKPLVWHHHEDGTTMMLLPRKLHNNVPHSGGVSVARDKSY